ncbi:hypothetical protein, partial [Streptomyces sp. NPDC002491]
RSNRGRPDPQHPTPDQEQHMSTDDRPNALDALLAHVTDNLPNEETATARARAALAPLEKRIRAAQEHERAEIRNATLREAIDVAREEGHRLEEVAGIAHARGARSVAYILRKLLAKEQPAVGADQEQRDEQQAQAHLDQLADLLPPLNLLQRTESYLSAMHGSVGRHDNLAANLGCAGCELRDKLRDELHRRALPTDRILAEPS